MTTLMPDPNDDDLLAAEFAFGLLDPADRSSVEARLATDAAFARRVARWQAHALTMLDGDEEAPPPLVWQGIARRLAANEDQPIAPPDHARLRFWRAASALAAAAALVLGVVAIRRPAPVPVTVRVPVRAEAPLIAVLAAKGRPSVTIMFDRASGRLVTAPAGLEVGRRSAQLWVIPSDGTPRPLGLVAARRPNAMPAPPAAAGFIRAGSTLAISLEPAGGSPTGRPTGPVILTGPVTAL